MYRIVENTSGSFTIDDGAGLVKTTEGGVFMTTDRGTAEEALKYLNQTPVLGKRRGSHRMKSTFGITA